MSEQLNFPVPSTDPRVFLQSNYVDANATEYQRTLADIRAKTEAAMLRLADGQLTSSAHADLIGVSQALLQNVANFTAGVNPHYPDEKHPLAPDNELYLPRIRRAVVDAMAYAKQLHGLNDTKLCDELGIGSRSTLTLRRKFPEKMKADEANKLCRLARITMDELRGEDEVIRLSKSSMGYLIENDDWDLEDVKAVLSESDEMMGTVVGALRIMLNNKRERDKYAIDF